MEFLDNPKIARIFDTVILILLVVIIGILVKDVFFGNPCECESTDNIISMVTEEKIDKTDDIEIEKKKYMVDVKGSVKKPGVYQVDEGTIINDVIKLAGGLKSNASTKYINLSKKVSDEMVLMIYTNYEISKMNNPTNQVCESSNLDISKCDGTSVIVSENNTSDENKIENNVSSNINNKISLNSGTKEQLMTLSGIGESKALAIIEYRTKNNGFKTLEELMNVSGIGESAYSKIKEYITL